MSGNKVRNEGSPVAFQSPSRKERICCVHSWLIDSAIRVAESGASESANARDCPYMMD